MSISEELNSLDNIDRKLELLETLVEHMYKMSNKIVSNIDFKNEKSFEELRKTCLKISNLSSKIYTLIETIRFNPGSLPDNSEVISFSIEEITTLIRHLKTLLLKEDCRKSNYEFNADKNLDITTTSDPTDHLEDKTRKEIKRVTLKDTVTIYEYNEEAEILDSTTTVRECSLNDETRGFCSKDELLLENISHGTCKSYIQPALKTRSSYVKRNQVSSVNSENTQEQLCTPDISSSVDGYCKSREDAELTIDAEDGTSISDKKTTKEKLTSNEILSTSDQCTSQDTANDFQGKAQVSSAETFAGTFENNCRIEECFTSSDIEEGFKNVKWNIVDKTPNLSHECSEKCTASTEDSPSSQTYEEPTYYEQPTTENIVMPDSDKFSVGYTNSDINNNYRYSLTETATTDTATEQPSALHSSEQTVTLEDYTTTGVYTGSYNDTTGTESSSKQPPVQDTSEHTEQIVTMEVYTSTEAYSNSYYDSMTTECPSVFDNYGYSSDYTTTEGTTITEGYDYSYDSTTEQTFSYGSNSYSETTTEQIETTTERDLSALSQNIYSVAQDLSTKAQEISTVTSEISTKVSEISSVLSDISTDDQDMQNKIQELSKLTQEISSKTSEISTLSSETSRLASDISTASNDIPNVDNKAHPHRISPRQRITSKSQDLITSTQNVITAAQDIIVKIQDVSFRSYDLNKADMISTASHDITSRTQGIITEALDIVTAALEIMTSVDF